MGSQQHNRTHHVHVRCTALARSGRPNKRSLAVVFPMGDVAVLRGSRLTGSRLNRKQRINCVRRSGDVVWPRPGRE